MKIKAAVSKNLLIFLKKCLTHDVTLKAFGIKPPIKLQKKTLLLPRSIKKSIAFSKEQCQTKITELQHQSEWLIIGVKERIEWCLSQNYRMHNKYIKRERECQEEKPPNRKVSKPNQRE